MRLFVAWRIPAALSGMVDERVRELKAELPRATWTRPASHHLTFAFLGEQKPDIVEPLTKALQEMLQRAAAFDVSLGEVGFFSSARRPRVAWLGVEPAAPLQAIAGSVRAAVRQSGLPVEEKPFVPHLTIARIKEPWPQLHRERLAEMLAQPGGSARMDRVELIESRLSSGGPQYRELARVELSEES